MPRMTGNQFLAEALRGLRRLAPLLRAFGPGRRYAADREGRHQDGDHARREGCRLHGGRLRARLAQAGHRALPGHWHDEPGGRPARPVTWRCSPVIAITGGQGDQPRYRHAYQNAEDFTRLGRASRRPTSPSTRSSAYPTCCARPSASRRPARRGRCTWSCAATAARCWTRRRTSTSSSRSASSSYPAFRPEPDSADIERRGGAAVAGGAPDHRRRRRRRRLRRRGRGRQAGRAPLDPDRHIAQRQGDHPGRPPAGGRRARQLLALVRQPRRVRGRPGVLHRQPHRRSGDQRLADARRSARPSSSSTSSRRSWDATTRTPSRSTATRRSRCRS